MRKILILGILLIMILPLKGTDLDFLKCWPVPFSPFSSTLSNNGKLVIISQIDSDTASIKYIIFTLTGDIVYSGNLSVTGGQGVQPIIYWDGKNTNGRYVADGGYIIKIQANSNSGSITKFLKLLVIRNKS